MQNVSVREMVGVLRRHATLTRSDFANKRGSYRAPEKSINSVIRGADEMFLPSFLVRNDGSIRAHYYLQSCTCDKAGIGSPRKRGRTYLELLQQVSYSIATNNMLEASYTRYNQKNQRSFLLDIQTFLFRSLVTKIISRYASFS